MGRGGGGRRVHKARLLIACGGEGEARATALVLHTLEMHVDLSFSYLRFAEAASFDKKELRRSCTDRPAYMGGVSPVLYRLLYWHDLSKHLRLVQISAGAYIFTISWGKVKNLSWLISVLSLPQKFVHDHKSCPNSAATLLSP